MIPFSRLSNIVVFTYSLAYTVFSLMLNKMVDATNVHQSIVNSLVAVRGIFTVAFWLLLWQVGNWADDLKSLTWELAMQIKK